MRTFFACLGLALYLLVVLAYQPFRDVGRGWAAQQMLGNPPLSLAAPPEQPNTVVHAAGVLEAAPDVRRLRPFEPDTARPLLALLSGDPRAVLAPGSLLRSEEGAIPVEGGRVALAGTPADYPFGARVALYGLWQEREVEVWAVAPDAAGLAAVAVADTSLLRWPGLLAGLVMGALGYAVALAGTLALRRALARPSLPGPRTAAVSLAIYILVGYLLLSSAWAMLWPTVAGVVATAVSAWWLARRRSAARPSAAP